MAVNLAEKYSNKVDERFKLTSLTNAVINRDYDFVGVKTVKVYSVNTVTPGDYKRTGADRYGTPAELDDAIQELTMSQDKGFTSKIFSLAVANGYTNTNPVRDVKKMRVTNKLERHLSVEEEKRMYQVCDDDFSFSKLPREEQERLQRIHNGEHAYLKPILIMALNTGMRKGEILNMTWDCVDFDKNEISALNTKNGKKNTIPMSSKLRNTLLTMYKMREQNQYVFTNPYTGTKYNDIKKCFKTVCKLAGVENLRFHDLRHTGATRMVAAGVPLPVVKQILNHANIQTTMRYAHTMREQEISAVEALANFN